MRFKQICVGVNHYFPLKKFLPQKTLTMKQHGFFRVVLQMDDFEAVDVEKRTCGKCSIVQGGIQCCLAAPPRGYVCASHVALLNRLDGVPSGTQQKKRIEVAKERRAKKARITNQYALILATNREECKQDDSDEYKQDPGEYKHDNDQDEIEQRITELRRSIINQRRQFYEYYTKEKDDWVAERNALLAERNALLGERNALSTENEKILLEDQKQHNALLKEKTELELQLDDLCTQNKHLQSFHEKAQKTITEHKTQIEIQEAKLKKQHTCFQEHDLCIKRLNQENTNLQAHCAVLQAKLANEQQTAWEKCNQAQNQIAVLHTQLAKQNRELEYTKCQLQRKTIIEKEQVQQSQERVQQSQEQVQQAKRCWVCNKPSHVGQCSVH